MYSGLSLWNSNGSCNALAHNTEKKYFFFTLFQMKVLYVHTMGLVQQFSKNLTTISKNTGITLEPWYLGCVNLWNMAATLLMSTFVLFESLRDTWGSEFMCCGGCTNWHPECYSGQQWTRSSKFVTICYRILKVRTWFKDSSSMISVK